MIRRFWRFFSPVEAMPLKDELVLTPWQKWKKYHRFPWKLVIDSIVVVISLSIVLLVSAQTSSYSLQSNESFRKFFLVDSENNMIYDTESFISEASRWVNNYYNLGNIR